MQKLTSFNEIESAVEKYGEIVVTKNDENDLVFMSMEEYKKQLLEKDIEEHLLKAEDDINNGRVRDAEDVFKEWKEKYKI